MTKGIDNFLSDFPKPTAKLCCSMVVRLGSKDAKSWKAFLCTWRDDRNKAPWVMNSFEGWLCLQYAKNISRIHIALQSLDWNQQGRRRRGQPKNGWRKAFVTEGRVLTPNRVRLVVCALCWWLYHKSSPNFGKQWN